jgi:hypothetical protein
MAIGLGLVLQFMVHSESWDSTSDFLGSVQRLEQVHIDRSERLLLHRFSYSLLIGHMAKASTKHGERSDELVELQVSVARSMTENVHFESHNRRNTFQ